ncbi:PREDICTED: uncharacterized protein LOC107349309 isoform X2 [Acropora digitifera]|uniref:uncharacterized protein LOC107349309 isoform X2 n=1 Tax=Acropora digitifera TaxID=70779 RepID=UPI00077A1B80|nr:PREDICTED: uncharacterized protein LOC107349309 isoform X2 [Acropora digitifera]
MEGGDEKSIYLIRENFEDSVCKRGIASAVSFQEEVFLLTSSSVVKEVKPNEKPKKLIAQRFSRRKFGAYEAEVSIYTTIDEFTFLKIDKECEFSNVDKSWSTSHRNFNVSAPSSERKALAMSPFCESLRQQKQVKPVVLECNGNNMIIKVITEPPIERTSILGAPIFPETKTTYTMKSDEVIGVVGLSSEEKLCSYYLNHNVLDLVSSKQKEMQSKRKGGIVKTPIEQDHPSGSEDPTSIKGPVKETSEPGQEIPQKSSQHIEEGSSKDSEDAKTSEPGPATLHRSWSQYFEKDVNDHKLKNEPDSGPATSSVCPSECEEATSFKDSVEGNENNTSVPGPAITPSKRGLFGKETEKCEILNRPNQRTRREEVDAPLTNHAVLNTPSNNFQKTLLSKPTSYICHEFYDEICTALDQDHPLGRDYNLLGEHIGLKKGKVDVLNKNGNPTKSMMKALDAQKDGTIRRFKEIMVKMERHDVLLIIEDWIKYEWNDPQRRNKWVF